MTQAPAPSTDRLDPAAALDVLRRHSEHSSVALALNEGTEYFTLAGVDGLLAYRPVGRGHAVQLGGVFATGADRARLLAAYHGWAARQRRRLVAVQLLPADLELYAAFGYRISQFGASFSLSVDGFQLRGRRFEKTRNKIARARRAGVDVVEAGVDLPYDEHLAARLDRLDAQWLAGKGRHVKKLEFLVGERARPGDRVRRLFVARLDGAPVAYVSYSPVFGAQHGWLYDITRRVPDAPPGVVELIFVEALRRFQQERVAWLHLGLTPFSELADEHRPPAGGHRGMDRLSRLVAEHGGFVYPARSQTEFKTKWQPDCVRPEYVAFYPRVSPGSLWRLMRLTRAI